jgi:hypothetical protein
MPRVRQIEAPNLCHLPRLVTRHWRNGATPLHCLFAIARELHPLIPLLLQMWAQPQPHNLHAAKGYRLAGVSTF